MSLDDHSDLADSSAGDGGEVILSLIEDELAREWQRRTALEGRALTFITLGTTLITATLVLASFTGSRSPTPAATVLILQAGLAALASAAGGVYGYWPRKARAPTTDALRRLVDSKWNVSADEARRACAALHIGGVDELRRGNTVKGRGVRVSGVAQVYALVMIVSASLVQLSTRP